MGIITALSATVLSAGLMVTGVHAASATSSITLPPGGVLEQRVTHFCARVPDLLTRADKAQARLTGDASTKGSLAWLKAREAQATAKKHPRVARRLDQRIERRTQRLAKLPQLKQKLAAATTECAALDLPGTSSGAPTSSATTPSGS